MPICGSDRPELKNDRANSLESFEPCGRSWPTTDIVCSRYPDLALSWCTVSRAQFRCYMFVNAAVASSVHEVPIAHMLVLPSWAHS